MNWLNILQVIIHWVVIQNHKENYGFLETVNNMHTKAFYLDCIIFHISPLTDFISTWKCSFDCLVRKIGKFTDKNNIQNTNGM